MSQTEESHVTENRLRPTYSQRKTLQSHIVTQSRIEPEKTVSPSESENTKPNP